MHFYFIFRIFGALQIRRDKLKSNNHNTLFVFILYAQCKNMFQEPVQHCQIITKCQRTPQNEREKMIVLCKRSQKTVLI